MTLRNELSILQRSVQASLNRGFLSEESFSILGVDLTLDPPNIIVRRSSPYTNDDRNVYLDPLFPLWERDWAVAFFGQELTGNAFFGLLPAWKYHQHKLLEFLQNREMEEFYKYLELFL